MQEIVEIHVIFRGRVQGVGFRATVCHLADQLGVKGTVRNQMDGSVEMIAQANKNTLDMLMQRIQREFGDFIQHVETDDHEILRVFDGFHIVR
jgi:acylphosphatase